MSFAALTQALNLPARITGPARMVAVALADHMSPNPELDNAICCWPSIATITKKAGVSESTVHRAIKRLTSEGVITVTHRRDQVTNRTNLYRWHPWLMEGWDEGPMRKREEEARGYGYDTPQEPQEQPNTPAPAPEPTPVEKPAQKPADGFDQWWATYPKKVKKRDAEKAYRAALKTGATPEQLLQALHQHVANWKARATAPQYIPYPGTWLRSRQLGGRTHHANQQRQHTTPSHQPRHRPPPHPRRLRLLLPSRRHRPQPLHQLLEALHGPTERPRMARVGSKD